MNPKLPVLAALWLALIHPAARAEGGTWLDAVRMERWSDADALAAAQPDPLTRKLALYFRLLAPGAARATELAAFMSDNPDWPGQAQLARRLADAMDQDGRSVRDLCQARAQAALPRCLGTVEDAVRLSSGTERARAAWVRGVELAAEPAFLKLWGHVLTAEDHWRRFDRLVAADSGAPGSPATRQAARLDPVMRPVAEARLALRRDDPAAAIKLSGRAEPSLALDLVRWHRRAGRDTDAAQVWLANGTAAEAAALPDRRGPFWDERNLLTRRLLRLGQPAIAYALASGHAQTGEAALDAEFLAGWIALRLGHPAVAARHFQALAGQSKAAITQGRAQYWIGRAATALEDDAGAAEAYAAASSWPTTYYGQLAARVLGDDAALAARIAALQDPPFTAEQAQYVIGRELARAAVLLVAWGEPRRAKAFLQRLDDTAGNVAERSAIAHLTGALGLPDHAVALARRAGRDGVVLPDSGWPRPVSPPATVERAVALALMRQESSFDIQAASPAGARGLMQLMPATAAGVARQLREPADVGALTRDPAYNMRLGTTYLRGLLEQFGGALPLALAGYNAGPSRVNDWIASNGDPRTGAVDMTDWIELIPFSETRNYVQRVLENVEIYRARHDATLQFAGGVE